MDGEVGIMPLALPAALPMPEIPRNRKRAVFVHPDGTCEIVGAFEGEEGALPVTAENFYAGGRLVAFASLVKVTRHAAFYKEPMTPQSYGSMHPDQQ